MLILQLVLANLIGLLLGYKIKEWVSGYRVYKLFKDNPELKKKVGNIVDSLSESEKED